MFLHSNYFSEMYLINQEEVSLFFYGRVVGQEEGDGEVWY